MNQERTGKDLSKIALLFSFAVYPGSGQFIQKRWLSGAFYMILFTACFAWLLYLVILPIFHNLSAAMDPGIGELQEMPWKDIAFSFGFSMGVYVLGLIDTLQANNKKNSPPPLPRS